MSFAGPFRNVIFGSFGNYSVPCSPCCVIFAPFALQLDEKVLVCDNSEVFSVRFHKNLLTSAFYGEYSVQRHDVRAVLGAIRDLLRQEKGPFWMAKMSFCMGAVHLSMGPDTCCREHVAAAWYVAP